MSVAVCEPVKGLEVPVRHVQPVELESPGGSAAADEDPLTRGGHPDPVDQGRFLDRKPTGAKHTVFSRIPGEDVSHPPLLAGAVETEGPVSKVQGRLPLPVGPDAVDIRFGGKNGADDRIPLEIL